MPNSQLRRAPLPYHRCTMLPQPWPPGIGSDILDIVAEMDDSPEITQHYESMREEFRITGGLGELELLRTQEILRRHLPPPPSRILDVGGGTGVHAEWLTADGYKVHIVDLTRRHVDKVVHELGHLGVTAEVGDARQLTQSDNSFDCVLLLGPLYHLTTRSQRIQALRESVRVVGPSGIVAVAAISRFASLFDGLARGFLFDSTFRMIVERDLAEGQHRNPGHREHWFTTAYLHCPDELREEIESVGLRLLDLVGIEGLAGWLGQLGDQWDTEEGRGVILYSARAIEHEPSVLGLSGHLLAVARTPT
jgi:ubiquinone/menaquinone biosynthesis C-methylase UbiE